MNTYTVTTLKGQKLIKADSYDFTATYITFYVGTSKVHSIAVGYVIEVEKVANEYIHSY